MARISFAICLIFAIFTIAGCERQRKPGGPGSQATSFPPCKSIDPGKPVPEADWSGNEMCNQEGQKDAHMTLPAVAISQSSCPGIHIHHDQDFVLNISPLSDPTGNCPANPFTNKFPFDSGSGHVHEFRTLKARDTAVGCSYEILFEPKAGAKCDPHVAIGQ